VLLKADESGVEAPIHESTITLDGKQHEAAFKSVSEADRNAIREAHKSGISRRNIPSHIRRKGVNYSVVKSVLDEYENTIAKAINA